jgi:signal transduction histidine kinase
LARELLGPTLMKQSNPTDNLTGYLGAVVERIRRARDEAEATDVLNRSAAEIRECMNAERLAAASRLAGWLAHKINNPLGSISGNAQLLARRLERDTSATDALQVYMRYIEAIQNQTERSAGVTNELLEFTRPRDVRLGGVDLAGAVLEAIDLACYGWGRKNVIVAEGVKDLPKANTDKDLLVRVLYEVILNAIQATSEDGAVTIDAGLDKSASGEADRALIIVTDNGPGIAEEVLPRVFEPFFSTREKARGLGLTTSLSIMRRLNGSLEVSGAVGSGATVSIRVPVKRR